MDVFWKRNPAAMHEHVSTLLCEIVFGFDTIAQINLYQLASGHKDFASNEIFPAGFFYVVDITSCQKKNGSSIIGSFVFKIG